MHPSRPAAAAFSLSMLLLLACPARAETRILHDFEHTSLKDGWIAQGPVSLDREPGPPREAGGPTTDAPGGKAVHVTARGKAAILSRPVTEVTPWPSVRRVGVWIHRGPAAGEEPDVLELQLLEPGRRSRFWRKLVLDHQGWKRFEIPLAWMRWSEGRIPRWSEVDRLGFHFRDPADLWIDSVSVDIGSPTDGASLTLDDLAAVAFPGVPPGNLVRFVTPDVWILSTGEAGPVEAVGAHLVGVAAKMRADMGSLHRRDDPGILLILEDAQAMRAFVERLAGELRSHVEPPDSDGFTLQGIAMGSWGENRGIRPSFTHEFAHSFSERRLELPNRNEWLHEAIATSYQLRFHPQENHREIVTRGLSGASRRLTLAELTDGRQLPIRRYWQALILLDMLQRSARHAAAFPQLIEAFREAGSTKLAPHLELLGTDFAALEAEWRAWATEHYTR